MALKFPIFMDAQSTTPCDPRVVVDCASMKIGNFSAISSVSSRGRSPHGVGLLTP